MRTNKPEGATHQSAEGYYYKLSGNFWYVFVDGGWFAVSGEPSAKKITKLKD